MQIVKQAKEATPGQVTTLVKGGQPALIKNSYALDATASWESGTDYDVYALVLLTSGEVIHVAAFGAGHQYPKRMSYNGVVHQGDVGRPSGGKLFGKKPRQTEVLKVKLDSSIRAVVPVVYSAQSNGAGSFARYHVSLGVTDGKTTIEVPADQANDHDNIYSCVPAVVHNTPEGAVIERVELYSRPSSEDRPAVRLVGDDVQVLMDQGPRNDYK